MQHLTDTLRTVNTELPPVKESRLSARIEERRWDGDDASGSNPGAIRTESTMPCTTCYVKRHEGVSEPLVVPLIYHTHMCSGIHSGIRIVINKNHKTLILVTSTNTNNLPPPNNTPPLPTKTALWNFMVKQLNQKEMRASLWKKCSFKGFVKKTPEKRTFIPQPRCSCLFANYMR